MSSGPKPGSGPGRVQTLEGTHVSILGKLTGRLDKASFWRDKRGAAMTEFALTFPILVFSTLFVLDVGRAAFTILTLSGAAADAARYASVRGTGAVSTAVDADIRAFALDRAFGVGPSAVKVDINWKPNGFKGAVVEVVISYDISLFAGQLINIDSIFVSGRASVTVH